jgi:hypothetical protein
MCRNKKSVFISIANEEGLFNISVQGADSVPLPDWFDQCCQEKGGHCGRINLRLSFQVKYEVHQFTSASRRRVGFVAGSIYVCPFQVKLIIATK